MRHAMAAALAIGVLCASGAWSVAAEPARVTVAVLEYECQAPGNPNQGSQIADILTARLSIDDGLVLVERAKLGKLLEEQKLKLVGLVDQEDAAKVGKLTGAKLLVFGKAFVMDKKLMIVTKVVGVETGRMVGSIRQVELSTPLSDAVVLLADDVSKMVKKDAAKLLPEGEQLPDRIGTIRKALGNGEPVTVAVVIPEKHMVRREPVPIVDPACETEIKKVLIDCGCKIVDTGDNNLADWAKEMAKGEKPAWPAALASADYVVVGEAFSEFALRTGDLVTCAGRAEVNVIDRKTGKIVLADRDTTRAVDLAENIAGKTALQQAGRFLGLSVGEALVKVKKAP